MRAKTAEKKEARRLRRKGWSIPNIAQEIEVSKGSVSVWVRDIPVPFKLTPKYRHKKKERQQAKLKEIREAERKKREVQRRRKTSQKKPKPRKKKERFIAGEDRWMIQAPPGYKGKTYIGGRYVYEHRYLMEQKLGRLLGPDEMVHHKNDDKLDNRLKNLEVKTRSGHGRHHGLKQGYRVAHLRCPECKTKFKRRYRKTASMYDDKKLSFCSRTCSGAFWGRRPSKVKVRKAKKKNLVKVTHQVPKVG
jgi:transposase-like protein